MSDTNEGGRPLCTATTQAGKPCAYTAVPGSDPPRCELHGRAWSAQEQLREKAAYYERYLEKWQRRGVLDQMDERSLFRELMVARGLLDDMLDILHKADKDTAEYKILVPFILRDIKLISDLAKQLGSEDSDHWNEVLDRLGDELDIEI